MRDIVLHVFFAKKNSFTQCCANAPFGGPHWAPVAAKSPPSAQKCFKGE